MICKYIDINNLPKIRYLYKSNNGMISQGNVNGYLENI
jgi:hypothetical protein